jgi:hypothetical protein
MRTFDMRTYTKLMADQHRNELVQMIPGTV